MKKIFAMLLAVVMMFSLVACGGKTAEPTTAPTDATVKVEGTMEELLNKVVEINPVEFMGGTMPIDLTDTSEDGLWMLKDNTGLENADNITDAAVFGPMMGSIAFSMAMVRTAEGADVKTVAETMKNNIDPRKWICVAADDIDAAIYGDLVLFVMIDSGFGMPAADFIGAFKTIAGGALDKELSK